MRRQDGWPWHPGLSTLTLDQVVEALVDASKQGRGHHVLTLNLDIYRQLARLPEDDARSLESSYTILLADGMPLVWGSALARRPVPGRVTGADLLPSLSRMALSAGLHVHFTGGPPGAADRAARAVLDGHQGEGTLTTSTFQLGGGAEGTTYVEAAKSIVQRDPDIVFSAYGFPKQDHLAVAVRDLAPSVTVIGCGASLEFTAGMLPRAPAALQRMGLEWLFRLCTEPRRLSRRYLAEDLPVLPPLLLGAGRARLRCADDRDTR